MTQDSTAASMRRWAVRATLELVLVAVLVCGVPASAWADARFRAPLTPKPLVVRGFDPPDQRWESGHRGVDLAATAGVAVLAAGSGTVRFAGSVAGKPVVSIAHAGGLLTTYEPVRASVRAGQTVRRGEVIGTVEAGHADCAAPGCLHWGARRGTGHDAIYLDPLALLGAVRVRLKPVGPGVTPGGGPAGEPRATSPR